MLALEAYPGDKKIQLTSMHSSRMRTARSSSRLGGVSTRPPPTDQAPPETMHPPPGTMHPPPRPGTTPPQDHAPPREQNHTLQWFGNFRGFNIVLSLPS